jgi:hypothetical protein
MDDINEELLAETISRCHAEHYCGMGTNPVTLSADDFLTLIYAAIQWKNEKWKARQYDKIKELINVNQP